MAISPFGSLYVPVFVVPLRVLYIFRASFLMWPHLTTMDGINAKQKWINVHRILNMLRKAFLVLYHFRFQLKKLALFGLCYAFSLWSILAFSLLHVFQSGGIVLFFIYFFFISQMRLCCFVLLFLLFSVQKLSSRRSAVNCKIFRWLCSLCKCA